MTFSRARFRNPNISTLVQNALHLLPEVCSDVCMHLLLSLQFGCFGWLEVADVYLIAAAFPLMKCLPMLPDCLLAGLEGGCGSGAQTWRGPSL